jgi:hypothetical protein
MAMHSSAERSVRDVASRLGLTEDVLSNVCLRMKHEYVLEEWQLPALDSFQWNILGAPIGLAAAIHISIQDGQETSILRNLQHHNSIMTSTIQNLRQSFDDNDVEGEERSNDAVIPSSDNDEKISAEILALLSFSKEIIANPEKKKILLLEENENSEEKEYSSLEENKANFSDPISDNHTSKMTDPLQYEETKEEVDNELDVLLATDIKLVTQTSDDDQQQDLESSKKRNEKVDNEEAELLEDTRNVKEEAKAPVVNYDTYISTTGDPSAPPSVEGTVAVKKNTEDPSHAPAALGNETILLEATLLSNENAVASIESATENGAEDHPPSSSNEDISTSSPGKNIIDSANSKEDQWTTSAKKYMGASTGTSSESYTGEPSISSQDGNNVVSNETVADKDLTLTERSTEVNNKDSMTLSTSKGTDASTEITFGENHQIPSASSPGGNLAHTKTARKNISKDNLSIPSVNTESVLISSSLLPPHQNRRSPQRTISKSIWDQNSLSDFEKDGENDDDDDDSIISSASTFHHRASSLEALYFTSSMSISIPDEDENTVVTSNVSPGVRQQQQQLQHRRRSHQEVSVIESYVSLLIHPISKRLLHSTTFLL